MVLTQFCSFFSFFHQAKVVRVEIPDPKKTLNTSRYVSNGLIDKTIAGGDNDRIRRSLQRVSCTGTSKTLSGAQRVQGPENRESEPKGQEAEVRVHKSESNNQRKQISLTTRLKG